MTFLKYLNSKHTCKSLLDNSNICHLSGSALVISTDSCLWWVDSLCVFNFLDCEFMFLGSSSVNVVSSFGFKVFSSRVLKFASGWGQGLIQDHFKLLAKAYGEPQKQVV